MSREAQARTKLIETLRKKGWTIGFAESCTGGRLSASLAEVPGVSDIFLGSVVSYANEVKKNLLGVRDETLEKFGAVSEETAYEMARGLLRKLGAQVSVAITGIAGPSGGTVEKPVGTVCFAFAGPGFEFSTMQHFSGDRVSIQAQSVEFAMSALRQEIENLK